MNKLDKKILDALQDGFPISKRPYLDLGRKVGLRESETYKRISFLRKNGLIRRFRAIFDPEALGYKSTLVAMKVSKGRLDEVAKKVGRHTEVTHNYSRNNGQFNLWFTLIAPSKKRIQKIISQIGQGTENGAICQFPKTRLFKIKAKFKL